MKPDFFAARDTSKMFKIFCLIYSQGHLTFMENPIVRIAAKVQYKIPSLRTDSRFTDTISWSQGRPHRESCTFLQRSWSRKVEVDVNTFVRPHLRNWWWKPFSGTLLLLLLLLLLLFYIIIIIVVVVVVDDDNYYWVYLPSDHAFEVYSKCDSLFYYKDAMVCYYKVRQNKVEDQEKQLKSGGGGGGCRKAIEMCKSKKGWEKHFFFVVDKLVCLPSH